MLPYKSLIALQKKIAVPVYQQISNRLVDLIRSGVIKPGAPLPSSRQMATLLRVHRKTVMAAYEELYVQDWVETIPRKGIMVSKRLPEISQKICKEMPGKKGYSHQPRIGYRNIVPESQRILNAGDHRLIINDGFPDLRIAPLDSILKEYRYLLRQPAMLRRMQYGDPAGSLNLRESLSQFLLDTRGIDCTPENIMMTHGAQMAISLAARLILRPGSTVVVGEPNYFMANKIFEECGARLIKIRVDENGMDVDALERICERKKPDLLYVIPHHHHPTTVTLSCDRRMNLATLIRKYKIPVIEDDYDYDFHYDSSPILPLASADHGGHVISVGSLSKCLAPSVRVGYMVAPSNFVRQASELRKLTDVRSDNLLEESLAIIFKNGDFQRHLKKSVKLYRQRRDFMCSLLNDELGNKITFTIPSGGMALWVKFNKKYPLSGISARASARGLYISDGLFYDSPNIHYNAIRMGFASLNEKEMRMAVDILKSEM